MEQEQQKSYESIDVQGLSKYLADDSYKARTKGVPEDDLYPVQMSETRDGPVVGREIASKFSHMWHNIYDDWLRLIREYRKPDKDDSK